MRKKNKKELRQKEIEEYYTRIYANRALRIEPNFIETDVHPDCLFKSHDEVYAVEATGYFYQQETDYSNRLYKKVLRFINSPTFFQDIYKSLGKKPLLNIIDAIYYDDFNELVNDLIISNSVLEEVKVNDNYFYNNDKLQYNAYLNKELVKIDIESFLEQVHDKKSEFRTEITLKKGYLIPIKVIIIHNKHIVYNQKRTLVPIVSFKQDSNYNFQSLKSLIENKERKLKSIYIYELKKHNINYDKFVLLIHPIDYPIDIYPELIYSTLKETFKSSHFDAIVIILKDQVMVIKKTYYKLF